MECEVFPVNASLEDRPDLLGRTPLLKGSGSIILEIEIGSDFEVNLTHFFQLTELLEDGLSFEYLPPSRIENLPDFPFLDSLPGNFVFSDQKLQGTLLSSEEERENSYIHISAQAINRNHGVVTPFTIMIVPVSEIPFFVWKGNSRELTEDVWKCFKEEESFPDLGLLLSKGVTASQIYYLYERFATMMVWRSSDGGRGARQFFSFDGGLPLLSERGTKIRLPNDSGKFCIFDHEDCFLITPQNIWDHQRGSNDAVLVSRAVAREIVRRSWSKISVSGLDTMIDALSVEIISQQNLDPKIKIDIENYQVDDHLKKLVRLRESQFSQGPSN